MATCNADVPRHVSRGFETEGEMAPSMMCSMEAPCGGGFKIINGEKNRIASFHNSRGAGLFMQTENEYGQGDGMAPAPGPRGTMHFASGTADASKPTFMKLSNTDGSMISFDGGGGRKSTIIISTGDGGIGALFTKDFVALFCDGTELILFGKEGKITSTYHLIQETRKGPKGKIDVNTFGPRQGYYKGV